MWGELAELAEVACVRGRQQGSSAMTMPSLPYGCFGRYSQVVTMPSLIWRLAGPKEVIFSRVALLWMLEMMVDLV